MQSREKTVKPVLVAIILTLAMGGYAYATIMPTIASMVGRSDVILIGKVLHVDKPGEPFRMVTVQVKEFIVGSPFDLSKIKEFTMPYQRIGKKVNISFQEMKEAGEQKVFFLRYAQDSGATGKTPSFHLELSDVWFGVRPSSKGLIKKIKEVELRVRKLYDEK